MGFVFDQFQASKPFRGAGFIISIQFQFIYLRHTSHKSYTVESFIFVGLKFRGFQISDKMVGI